MELHKIEELLENYFEGNLNEEEEQVLRTYFSKENIPEHLIKYRELFGYFVKAKEFKTDKNFMLNTATNPKRNRNFILSVAASVVVALGVGTFMYTNYEPSQKEDLGTYDDPKIALHETQKALALLSKHLNTGYESVEYIEEYEITKNKIFNLD